MSVQANMYIFPIFLCLKFFLKLLFIFREEKGGRERERNINVVVASCTPLTGEPGLQPRHVPQLGIEPATLWFAGWPSVL